ncbi:MAG: hypothetical protein KDD11_17755, partial [Acidobacteria bacterium]|nr:hypothetical protein [Acidobacteriota bacterium]
MHTDTANLTRHPALRAVAFAVAPVLLLLAFWLLPRVDVNATPWLGVDRDGLLTRATLAAARHGIDTGGWVPRVAVLPGGEVERYLEEHAADAPKVVREIRRLVPAAVIQVIFEEPAAARTGRRVTLEMGPGGRELGFELLADLPRRSGSPPAPELAWRELRER